MISNISSVRLIIILVLISFTVDAAKKKKIIKEINICKRNDPEIQKCYCTNFNHILPLLKDGVPEMNVIPIDPVSVEHIRMELPETKSIRLDADLRRVLVGGLSKGKAQGCEATMTNDGIQLKLDLFFPEVTLKSNYRAKGKFLLFGIDSDGDFQGEFAGMNVKTTWNSTRYMKNRREHLVFTTKIIDVKMDKMKIVFTNLLGNSTELNDNINETINSNIDLLYDEIKPVVLETIKEISLKVVNDFYATFSYDTLFPKE